MAPGDVGLGILRGLLFLVALAQLELVQAGLEHGHGLGAVAMLRTVALALNDDVRGNVGDAHRGVSLVDVLAAGAAGTVGVDPKVGGVDRNFDGVIHFRVDGHAGEGSMAARIGIERRLADQAVDAGFRAQGSVGIVARHLDRRVLDACDFAGRFLQHFDAEPPALAEFEVHAFEHRGPVLGFGASRARLNVEETVVRVHGIGEHAPEFHVGDDFLHRRDVASDGHHCRFVVFAARHPEQVACIAQSLVQLFQGADYRFQLLVFAPQLLGALGIIPDRRIFGQPDDFAQAVAFAFEVKDTSAVPDPGNPGRRAGWRSR